MEASLERLPTRGGRLEDPGPPGLGSERTRRRREQRRRQLEVLRGEAAPRTPVPRSSTEVPGTPEKEPQVVFCGGDSTEQGRHCGLGMPYISPSSGTLVPLLYPPGPPRCRKCKKHILKKKAKKANVPEDFEDDTEEEWGGSEDIDGDCSEGDFGDSEEEHEEEIGQFTQDFGGSVLDMVYDAVLEMEAFGVDEVTEACKDKVSLALKGWAVTGIFSSCGKGRYRWTDERFKKI